MPITSPISGSAGLERLIKARKTRVIGIIVLAFFIIYSITGFFVLP